MQKILAPLSLALMAASMQAHAECRHFRAEGHVTVATPTAPSGSPLTIRFSYDDDAAPEYVVGEPRGTGYGTANYQVTTAVEMRVNGHVMTAANASITVMNNGGGNVEDSISLYAYPMVLDGTSFAEGAFGFYLGSAPGKTKVLKSTALPRKIDVRRYDAQGFQYVYAQVDGSSTGGLLNAVIDSITEVPHGKRCSR